MKNTRDLLETTDLSHPDSTTTTTRVVVASREASEVASEEETVMEGTSEETVMKVASSEETAEETSAGHPEETSEVETHLEDLAGSADRAAVETMALEELALTNNEKGIF